LLLDRIEMDTVQTSARGTPLWVPQALGLEKSVLPGHTKAFIHAPARMDVFAESEAAVGGVDGERVETSG